FGDCVLAARDGGGSWSSPAFYNLVSGSLGFQAGLQDAQVVMLIMTPLALRSSALASPVLSAGPIIS
ncbi:MAG: hypothetical protein EBU14_15100, partial [Acetobacteraceae bacterium]|nr:hypothetical protein [Acetobacteraceae bacterium]